NIPGIGENVEKIIRWIIAIIDIA
ncbi:cadmium transporter, partial [Staphylococcus aureus]|nr:cadmium transporter [Staphylococcus aureus]